MTESEVEVFTPAKVVFLVAQVGLPLEGGTQNDLQCALNALAADLVSGVRLERAPTPRALARQCDALAAACSKVSSTYTSAIGSGSLHAFAAIELGGGGREAVADALAQVERLGRWAKEAATRNAAEAYLRVPQTKSRSFRQFIREVDVLYSSAFLKFPGRSTDTDHQRTGPFVRFLAGVHSTIAGGGFGIRALSVGALVAAWDREGGFDAEYVELPNAAPTPIKQWLKDNRSIK